jgi:hypothetical protein
MGTPDESPVTFVKIQDQHGSWLSRVRGAILRRTSCAGQALLIRDDLALFSGTYGAVGYGV